MIATEQYPQGLGPIVGDLRPLLDGSPIFTKSKFSACVEELVDFLGTLNRPQVVLSGIEAHVCVQQTALDLLSAGYRPFVCADAVTSRRRTDAEMAMHRLRQSGAVITTTESAVFELLDSSSSPVFKEILGIIK
jgi:isochorismate hydrolase